MPHPFYRKEPKRPKSQIIWWILIFLLLIGIALPWVAPKTLSSFPPLKYFKAVLTFPNEYEWEHTYRYTPDEIDSAPQTNSENNVASDSLFPLALGNQWKYTHIKTGGMMKADESSSIKTIEVTEEKTVNGIHLFKLVSKENDKVTESWYYWDDKGLHVTKDDIRPWRHSLLILKASAQKGDKWFELDEQSAENEMLGDDDLHLPSGYFDCIAIETRALKSEDRIYTTWYSQGIGIVRQHHGSKARGEDIWELESYLESYTVK